MNISINIIDVTIILIYIVLVLGLSFYFSRKSDGSSNDYFLGGRNLGWFVVGMSLFATNISSEHFIGLAGSGAARGLAVGQFELIAIFLLFILGWFLVPIYKKSGILTSPEFLEKRFNSSSRKLFSAISIGSYFFTKILVTLFAGSIIFNKILGWNIFTTSVLIVLLTGLYCIVGGFSVVAKTQVFQGLVLLLGTLLFTIFGLNEVGGFAGLKAKLPSEYFTMFKPMSDPDFPWTGIIFGAPIVAFWYWCADHYMVQRVLAAKSISDARTGTLLTSVLKIFPIFLLVLPGLIAVALFPQVQGDEAYSTLFASNIIPHGIKGIVLAGFLAAIMSSLSAAFNSTATLYTLDFFKPKHPDASDRTLVLVGRLSTIAVILVALIVIPFVKIISSHIYIFLQSTQAYISAPIAVVFLFGLTMKNIKPKCVFVAFIVGEILGISRFVLEILMKSEMIDNPLLIAYSQINYLHFAIFLFLGTSLLLFVLNFIMKEKIIKDKYETTVSLNRLSLDESGKESFWILNKKINIVISSFVLILILGLWSVFN